MPFGWILKKVSTQLVIKLEKNLLVFSCFLSIGNGDGGGTKNDSAQPDHDVKHGYYFIFEKGMCEAQ